jgi:hypothetical protein
MLQELDYALLASLLLRHVLIRASLVAVRLLGLSLEFSLGLIGV